MALFDVTHTALERALEGAAARQKALVDNIANANTPGFRRSDVDFRSSLSRAMSAENPVEGLERATFAPVRDNRGALRADGNNVDVDQELASLAQNSLEYQTLATLVRARVQGIKNVVQGAR